MLYLGKRPPIYIYYLKGGLCAASYIWYLLRFEMASLYLIVTPVSCKIKLNDMKLIPFSSSCVCSESIFTISRHKYLFSSKLQKNDITNENCIGLENILYHRYTYNIIKRKLWNSKHIMDNDLFHTILMLILNRKWRLRKST